MLGPLMKYQRPQDPLVRASRSHEERMENLAGTSGAPGDFLSLVSLFAITVPLPQTELGILHTGDSPWIDTPNVTMSRKSLLSGGGGVEWPVETTENGCCPSLTSGCKEGALAQVSLLKNQVGAGAVQAERHVHTKA